MAETSSSPPPRKKRRFLRFLIVFIVVLIGIRIALPYIVLYYANKKLASLDGNYGHIEDVDLQLYRGAYVIKNIFIKKVDGKDTTDFFYCPRIDLSLEWNEVRQKKLVGSVRFEQPVLKYTLNKTIGKGAKKDSTNFLQLVRDFMPVRINHFSVHEGQIHYIDVREKYNVDLPMTHVMLEGEGLTNEPQQGVKLPANIVMRSSLYDGNLQVLCKLDPLNDTPTFDLNAVMTKTNLINLNPMFRAYADFDVEKGTMAMYTEVAAKGGEFTGYVKPLIKDVDIVDLTKDEGSLPQIAWEAFLGTTVSLLTNPTHEQFATKVPFNGKFNEARVNILEAVLAILRNAFVHALRPSLDNSVSIDSVGKQEEKKSMFDKILHWKNNQKQSK